MSPRDTAAVWACYGTDKELMGMACTQYTAKGKALTDQDQLCSDKE